MNEASSSAPLDAELVGRAEAGDSEAMQALGQSLLRQQRPLEALDWLRPAARQGHPSARLEAARIQLFLVDTADSAVEAAGWLRSAEAAGEPQASYLLALLALGNQVEPRDPLRIAQRLRLAASRGFIPALRALALLAGRGPRRGDQVTASVLLGEAAEAGDAISALLLAERLRLGDGVHPEPQRAAALDAQLARAGHPRLPEVPPWRLGPQAGSEDEQSALDIAAALQPPPSRAVCRQPAVRVVDGLLTPEECRFLIASARPHLRRSRAFDPQRGDASEFEVRTSSDAAFDVSMEDFSLRLLQLRIARAGGCELRQGEPLVVLHYLPGQRYLPHRDYLPPSALQARRPEAGQRRTTVCVYLNPVQAGGQTAFTVPALEVQPRAGSAVVFENLRPDGHPDPDSQHAGMPVLAGEKWLATLWLRQGAYRRY